ncbi:MAG: alanine--glyoxylate aminotransferase family protein [Ichthyobacteriaceae bacterium]|nr:alanine--glyoxylate aminotransferase family protein [Ichthyobacteriaceae bacterium]
MFENSDNEMLTFAFPGLIEDDILALGSKQIPYMRTSKFSKMVNENEEILKELLDVKDGKVITYTSAGTAAMESVVVNYVSNFNKVLVINGGTFGNRWRDLCKYHNINADEFKVVFGKDINYTKLNDIIDKGNYDVLLCQHHETSSGQLYDLDKISTTCKNNNVRLVVDAISSFMTDDFSMKNWDIDMAVVSSQKGLNIPPGLSFVAIAEKALKQGFSSNNYYLDMEENLSNLQRGQTPFSPATVLFYQLHARLLKLKKEGAEKTLNKVKENALYFRQLCKNNNWTLSAESPSSCVTGFYVENSKNVCNQLNKENIYVMPSGSSELLRVSHIGLQNKRELDIVVNKIVEIQNNLRNEKR